VLDALIPGLNITGTIGPPAIMEVDCDDGVFCNGRETCADGVCVPGAPTCFGSTPYCIESLDVCAECLSHAQCDDGVFCNGGERCTGNECAAGDDPCPGQFCHESGRYCFECTIATDCDDGVACTIDICSNGQCVNFPDHPVCDDGIYCNGAEICHSARGCLSTGNPCHDPDSCDELLGDCGDCAAPAVAAIGPRYFTVSPTPARAPVLVIVSGDPTDAAVDCVFQFLQPDGRLDDQPAYLPSEQWASIPVTGVEVRPGKTYRVCNSCDSGGLSAIAEVTTWRYGDTNNSGQVTLDDVLCVLSGFSGMFGEPPWLCSRYALDTHGSGCDPDLAINIDEILAVLNAFAGTTTVPLFCPVVCPPQ
jgi:hypothetical protein